MESEPLARAARVHSDTKGFNLSLNLHRAGKRGGGGLSERRRERKKVKRRREIRSQRNGRNQEDLVGENLNSVVGLWGCTVMLGHKMDWE